WLSPEGGEMTDEAWDGTQGSFGMSLNGEAIEDVDERGERIRGSSFLLLFNAAEKPVSFALPPTAEGHAWTRVLDTASEDPPADVPHDGNHYDMLDRSLVVLRMDRA